MAVEQASADTAILAATRAVLPRIAAAAQRIDDERRLPPDLVAALTEAGLFRLLVPRSVGGAEVSLRTFSEVIETVATVDGSTAWCVSQNGGVSLLAGHLPAAGAREVFGAPGTRVAGGHGPATAVAVEGGYRLNGTWEFASGIRHATWLRGTCNLVDQTGERVLDTTGAPRQLIGFFPAEQATVSDVWRVSGLRGTASDTYAVSDLFVPAQRAVQDQRQEPGPLYAFGTTNVFPVGFASVALGLARASQEALIELAAAKTPRGLSNVLREQARAQAQVAQAEAALRAARLLLHQAIDAAWAAAGAGRLSLTERVDLRLATSFAIQRCVEVVDAAYDAAGGTAIFASNSFERRFRDIHALTQQVQARPDQYEAVGQYLFGLEPNQRWL